MACHHDPVMVAELVRVSKHPCDSFCCRLSSVSCSRALKMSYLSQDMIDDYEPALMFTIPRLAIVW